MQQENAIHTNFIISRPKEWTADDVMSWVRPVPLVSARTPEVIYDRRLITILHGSIDSS